MSMSTTAAYQLARQRAYEADNSTDYYDDPETREAARAWSRLAVRPRTRTAPPATFEIAWEDAHQEDCPRLIEAVERIAAHQVSLLRGLGDYATIIEIEARLT